MHVEVSEQQHRHPLPADPCDLVSEQGVPVEEAEGKVTESLDVANRANTGVDLSGVRHVAEEDVKIGECSGDEPSFGVRRMRRARACWLYLLGSRPSSPNSTCRENSHFPDLLSSERISIPLAA
eukprot:767834-Hanusia_phi.AAC.4